MSKTVTKSNHDDADKYMQAGIKEHGEFTKLFRMAKDRALTAGMLFMMAKAKKNHTEWGPFIEKYANEISARTVRFYMEFTLEALAWARHDNPKLTADDKALEVARKMVMQSPKGLVNLCRDLKLMRKFGEYDEVKYREKKLRSSQIEFDFVEMLPVVDALARIGDENVLFKLPEGVKPKEFYTGLEGQLETALKRVREAKKAIVDV